MENKEIEKVSFDYYRKSPSYLKTIVDMIPESMMSIEKRNIIGEIYNYYLNHASKEKIDEIIMTSRLFREKLALVNHNIIVDFVRFVNNYFINNIIFNSINRDILLDILNENVKTFAGYYDLDKQDVFENNQMLNHFNRR